MKRNSGTFVNEDTSVLSEPVGEAALHLAACRILPEPAFSTQLFSASDLKHALGAHAHEATENHSLLKVLGSI